MKQFEDYYWLNKDSKTFLSNGYCLEGQTVEDKIDLICSRAEKYLKIEGFADKFKSYIAKGYYSLSSPVWANYGEKRGLPVSCFNSHIPDSVTEIFDKLSEVGTMTKMGGGTSGYFGAIRPRGTEISVGGKADGPVRFMELFDLTTTVISQGSTRRGAFAAYLPVEHPDILEFLEIKSLGNAIQDMHFAVTISDKWMEEMLGGDKQKRKVWGKIIKKRYECGEPYVIFIDNANNNKPQVYKDKGMRIYASNVCSEIFLPSNEDESFVCVLSSLNLMHWDEMVKTDAIETLIYFLDTVNEEFIIKTKGMKHMEAPHNFAKRHRALGMGVLGWHSYLQNNMIPFESMEAKQRNNIIFKTIRERADKATEELADKFGEPEVLKGTGRRNTTTMAIAPTTSSSHILGQISQGIEPLMGNYYVKRLAKGKFTYKNPIFKDLLERHGKNKDEVWNSVLAAGGSCQHLDFLSDVQKATFKTWEELSQKEILIQASQRQKYIDQGQSLNVLIHPDVPAKQTNMLMIDAWKLGIKALYYQRSNNPSQEVSRNLKGSKKQPQQNLLECVACEG